MLILLSKPTAPHTRRGMTKKNNMAERRKEREFVVARDAARKAKALRKRETRTAHIASSAIMVDVGGEGSGKKLTKGLRRKMHRLKRSMVEVLPNGSLNKRKRKKKKAYPAHKVTVVKDAKMTDADDGAGDAKKAGKADANAAME